MSKYLHGIHVDIYKLFSNGRTPCGRVTLGQRGFSVKYIYGKLNQLQNTRNSRQK